LPGASWQRSSADAPAGGIAVARARPPPAPESAPAPAPAEQEIVVTGTRPGRCEVRLADRALSARQFEALAGEWGRLGRALRVVHPRGASYACLARISFRLSRHGVRLIHFVERPIPRE
jgi:hypothetical protein